MREVSELILETCKTYLLTQTRFIVILESFIGVIILLYFGQRVAEICTQYAQKGTFNIFLVVFFATLAFAFAEPFLLIGYLISIALFGLYQAIFMANSGGAWDNAKKIVETELNEKGTALHKATVVGDTVGDPFKNTSSVALHSIIKFTTLFGLLAVEPFRSQRPRRRSHSQLFGRVSADRADLCVAILLRNADSRQTLSREPHHAE